ncbi:tyrosinase-like [Anomaloglossus baeobatrachus]|uniref:tyrosinase-like n=1 Tax=Anomaloglossus baeobatrachus TaxID=238106 RepID=UPI003F4F9374
MRVVLVINKFSASSPPVVQVLRELVLIFVVSETRSIILGTVCMVFLFLVLGFSSVGSQFFRACTTDVALKSRICCPLWNGSPCGEHAGRGKCPIKLISDVSQVSEISHGKNQCHDERMDWPTGYHQFVCRCKGNYSGYDCGECKYGHYGEKCDHMKILVRKEIRILNVTEREKFLRYLTLSKLTSSKDFVILVTNNRRNPKSSQFRNVSIYDLFAWIHHYTMKPIAQNCSYTSHRTFAHQGPAFLPWHRLLLLFIERQIQLLTGDEDFALPYYDWSRDNNCSICTDELLGRNDLEGNILNNSYFSSWGMICGNSENPNTYCNSAVTRNYSGCLQRNPSTKEDSGLPTHQDVLNALKWKDYDTAPYDKTALYSFRNAIEGFLDPSDGEMYGPYLHNRVHSYMGGTMADTFISANDPMFILHHSFVDWQTRKQQEEMGTIPKKPCAAQWKGSLKAKKWCLNLHLALNLFNLVSRLYITFTSAPHLRSFPTHFPEAQKLDTMAENITYAEMNLTTSKGKGKKKTDTAQ